MASAQPKARFAISCGFPECGEAAAMVEFIPVGSTYPDGAEEPLHRLVPPENSRGTFRLTGFLPFTGYSTPVAGYEAVVAAVRQAGDNADAVLHDLNREYAPFFCRHCRLSYCKDHWRLKPIFDEAGFDYYSGDCPAGHPQFIDH
jgi:hypothetical protein